MAEDKDRKRRCSANDDVGETDREMLRCGAGKRAGFDDCPRPSPQWRGKNLPGFDAGHQ